MAYGRSSDDVIDDVTWPWKVKVVIPISLRPIISKTARDRDSVLTGHHFAPQPYIKAVKKFTWRIYALSERLLVVSVLVTIVNPAKAAEPIEMPFRGGTVADPHLPKAQCVTWGYIWSPPGKYSGMICASRKCICIFTMLGLGLLHFIGIQ